MNEGNSQEFSDEEISQLFAQYAVPLRSFARGVLKNADLAEEVVQSAFVILSEKGHDVARDALKAWLYRVVYNEAITIRRRKKLESKTAERVEIHQPFDSTTQTVLSNDLVKQIGAELELLSPEQQIVVRKKIYEEKTFAAIAEELDLPLGTVLTRMRLALKKLKQRLQREMES